MYELRMHGRGGQGAVMGAELLAKALVDEGKYTITVPAFGFERRGAPVVAYLRFDDKVIRQHTNIYHHNCIICIDPTLPESVNIFGAPLKPFGSLAFALISSLFRLHAG